MNERKEKIRIIIKTFYINLAETCHNVPCNPDYLKAFIGNWIDNHFLYYRDKKPFKIFKEDIIKIVMSFVFDHSAYIVACTETNKEAIPHEEFIDIWVEGFCERSYGKEKS